MMEKSYIISYQTVSSVERTSAKTMANYLDREESIWDPFLRRLSENPGQIQLQYYQQSINGSTLSTVFNRMRAVLGTPQEFNAVSSPRRGRTTVPPPPSDTMEGQLMIGLIAAERFDDTLAAYMRFVVMELGNFVQLQNPTMQTLHERGVLLITAAHAAAALGFQKLSATGLKTLQAEVAEQRTILDQAVGEAEQVNAEHTMKLSGFRDQIASEARRLRNLVIRAERSRERRYRDWRGDIDAEVAGRFSKADARLEALDKVAERRQHARDKAFEDLQSLFHTQLRLRAPVALWEERATGHRKQAQRALRNFWIAAIWAIAVAIGVPFFAGDYVAGSFSRLACLPGESQSCVRLLSAKGPLTIAGILLTISVILWTTRLQYRVFLSERHLSLDAEEKKAFAETFMALKEDATVDVSNETIVLASLFRPTQDGIIKDEDGGLDLSAAAILAKQMTR